MKRFLSFILAALILTSSAVSCGKTEPAETNAPETKAAETDIAETDSPAPTYAYATDKITENGIAKAHIVLLDGASDKEKTAADELAYHIKLVSGADISVTNGVQEDSLPIIIATPDSYPELEELFPEDLAWLRDTGDGAKVRWGDDGFAIRMLNNKLYIFGATARGALNGVYDFIEDNMGVLWIRSEDMSEYPIIYDQMPTITLTKTDYAVGHREKSPFQLRLWTHGGTAVLNSRNKLNAASTFPSANITGETEIIEAGLEPFATSHNITWWIYSSPSYDPVNNEYWSTDKQGNHVNQSSSAQVNIWSDLTVQCVADSVLSLLDQRYHLSEVNYIGISLGDNEYFSVYPEMDEPYEYETGKFIAPTAQNYISTVYFSFLNKVAQIVGEKYPDVKLHAYAYQSTIAAPECELAKNVFATFCYYAEDLSTTIDNPDKAESFYLYNELLRWMEKTPNIQVYNYYGCYCGSPFYEKSIWYRMQSDLQFYAANGLNGMCPEGVGDRIADWCRDPVYNFNTEDRDPYMSQNNVWSMNALTFWLYSKLAWNPYEDVDALIRYFCDKVYGDGSEYMQEYYRALHLGWVEGGAMMEMEFNMCFGLTTELQTLWDYFLDVETEGIHVFTAIQENLRKAYEAADEQGKTHIKYIMDIYEIFKSLI